MKTKWQNPDATLTALEAKLIEKIRHALAPLAIYEAYPYLPIKIDEAGLREIRRKDGTQEEEIADKSYRQAQRRQLFQDGQLFLAKLRSFLDKNATADTFAGYFALNLVADSYEEDSNGCRFEDYGLRPFGVSILAPTRTLCEKIMSLVRFSHTPEPISDLRNKIRHIYDLHQLLQQQDMALFFESAEFEQMLHKVAQDDEVSFRNNKEWLYHHPAHALVFANLEKIWPQLRATYNGRFKSLIYGELPAEQQLLESLSKIGKRLQKMEWKM